MARIRQIYPTLWTSEQVNSLPLEARLLFIGMFSNADDEGRLKAGPRHLKTLIFPADSFAPKQVKKWRDMIAAQGLIVVYTDGVTTDEYLYLPTWRQHQYIHKRFPSRLPSPPSTIPVTHQDAIGTIPLSTQGDTSPAHLLDPDLDPDLDPEVDILLPRRKKETATSAALKPSPAKRKSKDSPDPRVTQVLKAIEEELGYPTAHWSREVKEVKAMLRTYFPEEILHCWRKLKAEPFWQDKGLSMAKVAENIGEWRRNGAIPKPGPQTSRGDPALGKY